MKQLKVVKAMPIAMGDNVYPDDLAAAKQQIADLITLGKSITEHSVKGFKLKQAWVQNDDVTYIWVEKASSIIALITFDKPQFGGSLYDPLKFASQVNLLWVEKAYRGGGWGSYLYELVLKQSRKLISSDNLGIAAVGAWRALARKYQVSLWSRKTGQVSKIVWGANGIPISPDTGKYIADDPITYRFVAEKK